VHRAGKRKLAALEVIEPTTKRHGARKRQSAVRMVAEAANGQLDHWNLPAIEKTAHIRNALAGSFGISATDVTTMRKFVYDKGLVGGSQPEMLPELLAEICVVQQDNDAIIG
jgi:predicted acylesterase/phospholipase RssA